METKKSFKEDFFNFFDDPNRTKLRDLLKNNLGEFNDLDFKQDYCSYSKIAKHILGIANTGDGALIFGVKQNNDGSLESIGLTKVEDKTVIGKSIQKYLPKNLRYEIVDFIYADSEYGKLVGKKFQVIFVNYEKEYIPFVAECDGEELAKNRIYVRSNVNTEEANYEQIQQIITERIRNGYSSSTELKLEEHFSQLKILYKQIEKGKYNVTYENDIWSSTVSKLMESINPMTVKSREFIPNLFYPSEEYDQFISKMIELKKKKIESILKR